MIFKAIFTGVGVGLILAFLIGPAFFAIIQTSISRGFKYGIVFALGIALSDALFATLAFLGISKFLSHAHVGLGVGVIGGGFLVVYGITLWYKKPKNIARRKNSKKAIFKYLTSGFLLNSLNPAVLVYWVGMISSVGIQFSFNRLYIIPFVAGAIGTVFLTDCIKSFLAARLQRILKLRVLFWMNRVIGIALVVFGILMFYYVFRNFR